MSPHAGSQPKQNASNQNREENGSTTLRNTREKPLLAGYSISSYLPGPGYSNAGDSAIHRINHYQRISIREIDCVASTSKYRFIHCILFATF